MNFIAIDVETANADMASICQIGVAMFVNGELAQEWLTLVDPQDFFDPINVSVHGIDEQATQGQPTFAQVYEQLRSLLEGAIAVCHTHFDRVALEQACDKYELPLIATTWLDSARVVRRTWQDLAWKGYGLANVCARIGYQFKHHDALEDAKAAGHVLLAALRESSQDLDHWCRRVNQPINLNGTSTRTAVEGNPEGDLYGEVIVFTGALEQPRAEAIVIAARMGCHVATGVSKKTTILVVGDQDVAKLNGAQKSTKHRKAEELAAQGHAIRIIRETDFQALMKLT